jgi:hypothetical protein
MTQNTHRIVEEYNEVMRRAIFYVWDNTKILGAYQTQQEAEESITKMPRQIDANCETAAPITTLATRCDQTTDQGT